MNTTPKFAPAALILLLPACFNPVGEADTDEAEQVSEDGSDADPDAGAAGEDDGAKPDDGSPAEPGDGGEVTTSAATGEPPQTDDGAVQDAGPGDPGGSTGQGPGESSESTTGNGPGETTGGPGQTTDTPGEATDSDTASGGLNIEIDGIISLGEWELAQRFDVGAAGTISNATIWLTTDGVDLYIALMIPDDALEVADSVVVRFDNDNDDVQNAGDDSVSMLGSGTFRDGYFSGTSWGVVDETHGLGAVGWANGHAVFEMVHPLDSGAVNDMAVREGDTIGFCARYFNNGTSSDAFPNQCVYVSNEQALYQDITLESPL